MIGNLFRDVFVKLLFIVLVVLFLGEGNGGFARVHSGGCMSDRYTKRFQLRGDFICQCLTFFACGL